MLFVWKGSVLPRLLPRLTLLFLFTVMVVYYRQDLDRYQGELSTSIYTIFGIALAIFLGFRNTVSYERFWEGRKLWGALLNETRSLAQQLYNFLPNDEQHRPEKVVFIKQTAALTYALNHQPRGTDASPQLQKILSGDLLARLESGTYKPFIIMRELGATVNAWRVRGLIDTILQAAMDQHLSRFSEIIGGCERMPAPRYLFPITTTAPDHLYLLLSPAFWFCRVAGLVRAISHHLSCLYIHGTGSNC